MALIQRMGGQGKPIRDEFRFLQDTFITGAT